MGNLHQVLVHKANIHDSKGGAVLANIVLTQQKKVKKMLADLGGTMRLGSYPCVINENSLAHKIYNKKEINERHRHRYEFNLIQYGEALEKAGVVISGKSPDGQLTEIIERNDHPWFVAVQFHPEFKSRPLSPHPLFNSLIGFISKK